MPTTQGISGGCVGIVVLTMLSFVVALIGVRAVMTPAALTTVRAAPPLRPLSTTTRCQQMRVRRLIHTSTHIPRRAAKFKTMLLHSFVFLGGFHENRLLVEEPAADTILVCCAFYQTRCAPWEFIPPETVVQTGVGY